MEEICFKLSNFRIKFFVFPSFPEYFGTPLGPVVKCLWSLCSRNVESEILIPHNNI